MRAPFSKVQSVGNDFVLVELKHFADDQALMDFVIRSCERRFGVGSDGLLGLKMEGDVLRIRMFNPDGTEDFCGNGLRCSALWAYRHGWVGEEFLAKHLGRDVQIQVLSNGSVIRTQLGLASFDPSDIPLKPGTPELFEAPVVVGTETLLLTAVSTGTAHAVIFVDELPCDDRFLSLSPLLEHHELFPERTSIMWTRIADERRLELRIWERGVGETLGCGSGTTAAAATYMRKTGLSGEVWVKNPGGLLKVSAPSWDAPMCVEGQAEIVYEGVWGD